jgi:hypothetical protein
VTVRLTVPRPTVNRLSLLTGLTYDTFMRKNQPMVLAQDLVTRVKPLVGLTFSEVAATEGLTFPDVNGKGCVGHFVEDLVGLPRDNDRLDFSWGDLKAKVFHSGEKVGGCVIGSLNSLASEMIDSNIDFDDFILGKKIGETVLVTVCTNRRGGGPAGVGWQNFTFESVSAHVLRQLPEWEGVKEDWEFLKGYVKGVALVGGFVSSGQKGPNGFLKFNSCGGEFRYNGRNLRRRGGIQLALGKTLVRQVCA